MVCAACFRVSCWYGEFYCADARNADVTRFRASQLSEMSMEHPEYYSVENLMAVCGSVEYVESDESDEGDR